MVTNVYTLKSVGLAKVRFCNIFCHYSKKRLKFSVLKKDNQSVILKIAN